jgi:hypothetical protein
MAGWQRVACCTNNSCLLVRRTESSLLLACHQFRLIESGLWSDDSQYDYIISVCWQSTRLQWNDEKSHPIKFEASPIFYINVADGSDAVKQLDPSREKLTWDVIAALESQLMWLRVRSESAVRPVGTEWCVRQAERSETRVGSIRLYCALPNTYLGCCMSDWRYSKELCLTFTTKLSFYIQVKTGFKFSEHCRIIFNHTIT